MNKSEFFNLFSVDISDRFFKSKYKCYFCGQKITKMLFVKRHEEQESWYHICRKCFCNIPNHYFIRMSTNCIKRKENKNE